MRAIATRIVLEQRSRSSPAGVARCLQKLPHTSLNLERVFVKGEVVLANPVQHMLVTAIADELMGWMPPSPGIV